MQGENGDLISPGQFLPAAERYNLAAQIDYWVIDNVLKFLNENQQTLSKIEQIFINLSKATLIDENLGSVVIEKLKQVDVPAEKICFEVTENSSIDGMAAPIETINLMRSKGVLFALDDFGTGVSSFSYLRDIPVDIVKVDGSFVRHIDEQFNSEVVKSIHQISKLMGKQTIAEFVESEHIVSILHDIGVDYAQGYWLGKPRPLEEWLLAEDTESAEPQLIPISMASLKA